MEASLVGAHLHWGQYQADRLDLQGRLPATGTGGRLEARADGLHLAGQAFERAHLALTGSAAAFQARGELAGASGELSFEGNASGRDGRWQGRLAALRLAPRHGAAWRLGAPAGFAWQGGQLRFQRACLAAEAGAGQVCAQFEGDRASATGRGLAIALVEPWLGESVAGVHSFGTLDLDGRLVRAGATWNGELVLRSERGGLRLADEDTRTLFEYTGLQLRLQLRQSQFELALDTRLGDGGSLSGTARGGLAAEAPLQGELRLDLRDLTWMELLSPDLAAPTGRIAGRVLTGGSRAAPTVGGEARLAPFAAELPALGVVLREGDFQLRGAADGQARISGQVRSGRGVLRVDGQLNLRDRRSPLELTLRGEDITVVDTPDLEATMSPDLSLRQVEGNLQIRGVVVVPSARIDLERLDTGIAPSSDVVVLDPRTQDLRTGLVVDTDVELRLGEDVRLRGFGLDGELGGRLRVRDPPGREALVTGTLEVGGRYTAYGRPLEIKRGRLSYLNAPIENPVLDVLAEHEFEQATIGVRVRGSALAPETSISSSPAMATSEALSWLLLGRPLQTASSSETERISASAIALGAGSSLLAQRLGARLGLDSAGITESRTLGSTLMVGKQVSPRLFVSYGLSLVGTGQVVMLKYLLTRGLDIAVESGSVETAASINWRKEK
jgi:translocation and assembly module TamB